MHRHLYVLMAQLAESTACVRFHQIGPRLVRWVLMSQDRSKANSFDVTQEFLAYMLGVRRVGITAAAMRLTKRPTPSCCSRTAPVLVPKNTVKVLFLMPNWPVAQ